MYGAVDKGPLGAHWVQILALLLVSCVTMNK